MPQVANYAMRLNALFAQMQGLDNDAGTQLRRNATTYHVCNDIDYQAFEFNGMTNT